MKKQFKEIRVTHGESRGNSRRKHTLHKKPILYMMLFSNVCLQIVFAKIIM